MEAAGICPFCGAPGLDVTIHGAQRFRFVCRGPLRHRWEQSRDGDVQFTLDGQPIYHAEPEPDPYEIALGNLGGAVGELQERVIELEKWRALPWWKRMFR